MLTCAAALAAGAGADPSITAWTGEGVSLRNELRLLIGAAEDDVAVAMDRFTDYSMADALITVAERGRRVRVVVDADRKNPVVGKALGDHLKAGGVEVAYNDGVANLYDRFIIIDERVVVVGSYPFIEDAASSPLTDVVVINDEALAQEYLRFYEYIWNHAK